jgi:transcriptional regulator of acetoin/glycerol metabolism
MHWRSRFERAAEGSLYFDEIAHLPADAQGLLSRLIDSGFPARILCATRESPWETIRRGFKRHLYDRLVEELIELPPLRRRIEDIGPIGQSMLDNAQLTPRAVEVLRSHDWPGNGHELNDLLTPLDVLREVDAVDLRERLKMAAGDREWLEGVLWSHRGNVTAAAARIGVRRQELHRRIRRLGIPRGCGRENVA